MKIALRLTIFLALVLGAAFVLALFNADPIKVFCCSWTAYLVLRMIEEATGPSKVGYESEPFSGLY